MPDPAELSSRSNARSTVGCLTTSSTFKARAAPSKRRPANLGPMQCAAVRAHCPPIQVPTQRAPFSEASSTVSKRKTDNNSDTAGGCRLGTFATHPKRAWARAAAPKQTRCQHEGRAEWFKLAPSWGVDTHQISPLWREHPRAVWRRADAIMVAGFSGRIDPKHITVAIFDVVEP